jgi:putative FmdB family regulatory protein
MPIYEYRCQQCRHRFSRLWLSIGQATATLPCPKCAAAEAQRILSRVARVRSEDSRLESLADPRNFSDLDENDPASVQRWASKMGRELGDELGEDFSEALEETLATEGGGEGGDSDGGGSDLTV